MSDPAGAFVGITSDLQVQAKIDRAYSRMGRTLAHPAIPDAEIIETDVATGAVRRATSRKGAVTDYASADDPNVTTEWISDDAGTRVAPFTPGARELVVAYMPNGERRLLTPFGDFHFSAPRLAYGGKSVRAFKRRDGQSTYERFAISISGSGFMAPDDPLLLTVFTFDGQSLAQGSGGLSDFLNAWRTVLYPEHTLTLDNTVKPGDNRLGRNASVVDGVLNPATLGDFVPIKPQPGVATVHVYTPCEAFLLLLQEKIVRELGRPQRMCGVTLGIGGQSITAIGPGTQNETNKRVVQSAIVARATPRGWRVNFAAVGSLHGETDATMATATYKATFIDWQDRDASYAKGLTGQTNDPVWLISQNSSLGEDADNETSGAAIIAFMELMRSNPARNLVYGPDYPFQAYYADFVHFLNEGYFRKTEVACAAFVHQVWGCGGRPGRPVYLLGATYAPGSSTITLQWSRPIVRDTTLVPVRPMDGIEVAIASGQFLTITDHTIAAGATTSTITLSAPLTTAQQSAARVQIGMLGQQTPRVAEAVPGTNIRAAHSHDTAEIDRRPIYPFACHDRLPLTII